MISVIVDCPYEINIKDPSLFWGNKMIISFAIYRIPPRWMSFTYNHTLGLFEKHGYCARASLETNCPINISHTFTVVLENTEHKGNRQTNKQLDKWRQMHQETWPSNIEELYTYESNCLSRSFSKWKIYEFLLPLSAIGMFSRLIRYMDLHMPNMFIMLIIAVWTWKVLCMLLNRCRMLNSGMERTV